MQSEMPCTAIRGHPLQELLYQRMLINCIGVLVSWSQHRRLSREVVESWQLYVTDRSFIYTILDSGHPSTVRIPLANIEAVAVNEPLAECGPATCLCSTGPDAVVVHCKNKLVILKAEWLPWLQTNWRDSGYESYQHKATQLPTSSYNHKTLTICKGVITNASR